MEPEPLGPFLEQGKSLGFGARFAPAFFAVVNPVAKIDPLVLNRVKKATDAPVFLVQVPKGPATESSDRPKAPVLLVVTEGVFPEHALDDGFVPDMLVTGRPYGRAAGETGLLPVRRA
jgi:hypothetical protein